MIKTVYIQEKVGIINTMTAWTSLLDLLRSEEMESAYNSIRSRLVKGEITTIKNQIIRKVQLKHYKHGKQ
jgi:hypothetical protein